MKLRDIMNETSRSAIKKGQEAFKGDVIDVMKSVGLTDDDYSNWRNSTVFYTTPTPNNANPDMTLDQILLNIKKVESKINSQLPELQTKIKMIKVASMFGYRIGQKQERPRLYVDFSNSDISQYQPKSLT